MRLITVEPVLFVYIFALVVLTPLLQQYIYDEFSKDYNFTQSDGSKLCTNQSNVNDNVTDVEKLIQTKAAHWFIGLSLSASIPSLFATVMYGSMSDAVGRKPIILFATCGVFVRMLLSSLTITFDWPFYVLFLGSFVEGLSGAYGTIIGSTMAYVVDSTDNRTRSMRLGILEMSVTLAGTGGYFAGGIGIHVYGYMVPLWFNTVLLLLSCFYIVFLLPESLDEKQGFEKFSCLTNGKRIKDFITKQRGPFINACLLLLLVSFFFAVFDYFGSLTVLYTKHSPLCWDPEMIGYYMGCKAAVASVGIVFVFKVLAKCVAETLIVVLACSFYILSQVIVGLATTTAEMFLSNVTIFVAIAAPPCIRSIASKLVPKHEDGALCSVLAVTESAAQLFSPLVLNLLYTVGLNKLHLRGFVFFVQAGLLVVPVVLFLIIHFLTKRSRFVYARMPEIACSSEIQT